MSCVPIKLLLSKFYARKTASLSKLTLHYGYEYLGHGEYYAGVRSGIERVLHATEALRDLISVSRTTLQHQGTSLVRSYLLILQ